MFMKDAAFLEQLQQELPRRSLSPKATQRFEDTYKLLLPSERAEQLRIKRNLKVFLKGDTAAQSAWYRTMREISALNADEIRGLEDMGTIPGGQEYYASWNYGPLSNWALLSVIRALGNAVGAKPPKEGEANG